MLNAEKYKDEILEFIDKEKTMFFSFEKDDVNVFKKCCNTRCGDCLLSEIEEPCITARIKWLLSEYKEPVKLTKFEYSILEWLYNECYEYIARDRDGDLSIFCSQPYKMNDSWNCDDDDYFIPMFNKLFGFIKWEDTAPVNIDNVLNNCEVIEND